MYGSWLLDIFVINTLPQTQCNNLLLLYDITTTYSVCVQYSYATVDLILMAVDQKDIEH